MAIGTDTEAWSVGNVSLALAAGPNERAFSFGTLATALAVGVGVGSTYAFVIAGDSASDFLNIAIGIGKDGAAWAGVNLFASQTDRGNLALFLGQGGMAASAGILNSAINVGGNGAFIDNLARAGGVLSTAVNLGGNNNSCCRRAWSAGDGSIRLHIRCDRHQIRTRHQHQWIQGAKHRGDGGRRTRQQRARHLPGGGRVIAACPARQHASLARTGGGERVAAGRLGGSWAAGCRRT